jgi:hypothetical protein
MPGIITVSQQDTFTAPPIVMSVGPRLKFNSTEQDVTRDGELKWLVQVAVSYAPQFGMKPVAEVIEVSVTGADPSASIAPGTPVEFNRLQVGVSAPEQRERKDGGTRISGGRLYWMAAGVRPAAAKSAAAA